MATNDKGTVSVSPLNTLPRPALAKRKKANNGCRSLGIRIKSLSDYFAVLHYTLQGETTFWFRGQRDVRWGLIPSALRYKDEAFRTKALDLLPDFKRLAERRLPDPPGPNENLKWVQVAQHYGLPTRLLDWTENPAVALYFACEDPSSHGAVFILNPVDLNRLAEPKKPRIFDANLDHSLISRYLNLKGVVTARGRMPTIAIKPVWDSERITLQQGVFTLHGNRELALTSNQVSSLVYLPILRDLKQSLLDQLQMVGIQEMSIFPEAEHVCRHLKRLAQLPRD